MSGLEPAIVGALISSGVGAASAAVQGAQSRRAQKRTTAAQLQAQREQARQSRIASAQEVEAKRQGELSADKLAKAKGAQISSGALAQRGIKARPVTSFADISKAVLDESAS